MSKHYDVNVNGQFDDGEPELNGWMLRVKSFSTGLYAFYESPQELHLPLGRYEVCDMAPDSFNWYQTSVVMCRNVTLSSAECVNTDSMCVCTGGDNSHPRTYWTGHAGQTLITSSPTDLAVLQALPLRNAAGTNFDPTQASDIIPWINSATSANPAYYLSVQLAVSTLNTLHFVWSGIHVKAPAVATLVGDNYFTTLAQVQNFAATLLTNNPPNVATMSVVAQAMLDLNNDQNYVQTSPCSFTFSGVVPTATPAQLAGPCLASTGSGTTSPAGASTGAAHGLSTTQAAGATTSVSGVAPGTTAHAAVGTSSGASSVAVGTTASPSTTQHVAPAVGTTAGGAGVTTGPSLPDVVTTGVVSGGSGNISDFVPKPAQSDASLTAATPQQVSPLSAGVIAGIIVASAAVAATVAAVLAKTAFSATTVPPVHWMDNAVQNPLYQSGESLFENPLYDPPVESV